MLQRVNQVEPFESLAEEAAERYSGRPGSHSWELLSALFGWIAGVALILYLIAFFAGYSTIENWLFWAFNLFLWWTLRRDYKRLREKRNPQ
jgi:hypothetical protein